MFLVFDVSMAGYAAGNRAGAMTYNLVHNYAIPIVLLTAYAVFAALGIDVWPLAFVAGPWLFHVGLDRALGYGPRPIA